MRKKLLNYIIRETKKKQVFSSIIEPTLEECYFLQKKGISVIKTKMLTIYPGLDKIEIFDVFNFFCE